MPAPSDFRLYHGNDLELLAGVLAAELAKPMPGAATLAPDTILVPQPAVRRWLQKFLAEEHGIAANLQFLAPGEFVRRALDANLPDAGDAAVGDAAVLRWRVWAQLDAETLARAPELAPLRPLLGDGNEDATARWQLAGEVAQAFEKYQAWRRDWLRRWDAGGDRDDWQASLWRRATRGLTHRGKRLDAYLKRFGAAGDDVPTGLPARLFAFACQNVSPDVLRVIASAARAGPLHFHFVSPVRGWWGDLRTARERLAADDAFTRAIHGPRPAGGSAVRFGNPAEALLEDDENPLLRANGAAGRDFVRVLFDDEVVRPDHEFAVYPSAREPEVAAPTGDLFAPRSPSRAPTLLQRLQQGLLERMPSPPPGTPGLPRFADTGRGDSSLQVHDCHTRLREVQVLHAQLRALLEADAALLPREIAVLTPDIDGYAPFVQAVFGGESIPYTLGDAAVLARHPAAVAFAQLLALPEARLGANEVLDLFAVPALAERLGLAPAELAGCAPWLAQAGARWGLDAAHRERLGAPAEPAYTWAFAIDRLLLGHATGSDADLAGVAPLPGLDGGMLATLDRLLSGLRRIAVWQRALATARPAAAWGQALAQLIADFFPEQARDAGDRTAIDDLRALVAKFADEAALAQVSGDVPPAVVRAWFEAALAATDARAPLLSGGVTFGRMVPMRLVPFKVICLLGLDDGAFPRRDPPGALNRLAAELDGPQRRVGDRSVRDDDRGLFLQLFAAAGQCFYISYLGQDPRSGEAGPPSVVVSELLDAAARQYEDHEFARGHMVVRHPLQPFSAGTLGADVGDGADSRRFAYEGAWASAAMAAMAAETRATPVFATPLPTPLALAPAEEWTLSRLRSALAHPPREFLRERLGLRVPEADDRLEEDEPFDTGDPLARHALVERTYALARSGSSAREELAPRLLAEGMIAPGAAGLAALDAAWRQVAPALAAWGTDADDPAQSLGFALDLDGVPLTGVLTGVHRTGLRQFSASKAHGKSLLRFGVDALVWAALERDEPVVRRLCDGPVHALEPIDAASARATLRRLLDFAALARREALPLMPKTAWCLVGAGHKRARSEWLQEGGDPWVQVALRGALPFAGDAAVDARFAELAAGLFAGIPGAGAAAEAPADD